MPYIVNGPAAIVKLWRARRHGVTLVPSRHTGWCQGPMFL